VSGTGDADLPSEIRRLGPWHHDVEIAPGIGTGPISAGVEYPPEYGQPTILNPARNLAYLAGDLFPDGFAGRSFLDCACNAGGYLFAARRLGAGRCFGFDARAHWIEQARFLARHLPAENIAFEQCALRDLPALGLEPFDVTYFSGIFYHLPDPVAGLRIAADHTRELIVVNTDAFPGDGKGLRINPESGTEVMSGVDHLAWLPTGDAVIRQILGWCGFPHSRVRFRRKAAHGRLRIEVLGAREEASLAHFDSRYPEPAPVALARRLRALLRR
jgi:SAM-dependent methyltransferase